MVPTAFFKTTPLYDVPKKNQNIRTRLREESKKKFIYETDIFSVTQSVCFTCSIQNGITFCSAFSVVLGPCPG